MKLYSTKEAAEYLGVSVRDVKYHVYEAQDLVPDKREPTIIFTEQTLEEFKKRRRPGGRPPKKR